MHATRGMRSANRVFRAGSDAPRTEEVSSPVGARSHTTMADQAAALRSKRSGDAAAIPQEILPQWNDISPEDRQRLLMEMSFLKRG